MPTAPITITIEDRFRLAVIPTPKLRKLQRDELPEWMRAAHDHSIELRGDASFFEVFGNHPELYRWYTEGFYGEVFRGGLVGRRVKELVRLRLADRLALTTVGGEVVRPILAF